MNSVGTAGESLKNKSQKAVYRAVTILYFGRKGVGGVAYIFFCTIFNNHFQPSPETSLFNTCNKMKKNKIQDGMFPNNGHGHV